MAYKLTYWTVKDQDTAYELKSVRLRSVVEVQSLSLPHQRPAGTDCILLERTDKTVGRKKTPNHGQYTRVIFINDKARNCSGI
jgi:hypothetical protein